MQLTFLGTSPSPGGHHFAPRGRIFFAISLPSPQLHLSSHQQIRRASAFLAKETRNFGGFFCARIR
jgi:hypothetical protein